MTDTISAKEYRELMGRNKKPSPTKKSSKKRSGRSEKKKKEETTVWLPDFLVIEFVKAVDDELFKNNKADIKKFAQLSQSKFMY